MTGNSTEQKLYNAKQYKLYAASKPKNLTPPRTHGNATTNGLLKVMQMASPRADADAHFNHPSIGLTVQIKKATF